MGGVRHYMEGNCREASFLGKTSHEFARRLSHFRKHDTNLQGSWLISENLTRICREAGFFQKSWHELARKLGSCKRKPGSCKNQRANKVSVVAQLDTTSPF